MKSLVLGFAGALGIALFTVVPACGDGDAIQQPCTDIPAGGCPVSYGVACDDPACVAVYRCNTDETWSFDHACPVHEAGPDVRDAAPVDAADAAVPRDADIDAPPGAFGGAGCLDLEVPDCTLGFALSCPAGCCDCEDLFVCQDEDWVLWGSCSLDKGIVPDAP